MCIKMQLPSCTWDACPPVLYGFIRSGFIVPPAVTVCVSVMCFRTEREGCQPRTADGRPHPTDWNRRLLFLLARWAGFVARPTWSAVCRMEATHTCVSPGVRVRRSGCIREDPSWPQTNDRIATFISSVKTSEAATALSDGSLLHCSQRSWNGLVASSACDGSQKLQAGVRGGRAAVNVLGCDPQSAVRRANCSWSRGWRESSPLGLAVCKSRVSSQLPELTTRGWWDGETFVVFFSHWHSRVVYKHKFNLPFLI